MTQRDDKERYKVRREKLADFFYALAKLTFAGLVVGGISPLVTGTHGKVDWAVFIFGLVSTISMAWVANRILKY